MVVNELRELLKDMEGNEEIYIRNTVNPVGNIADLEQVELSTYGFFGKSIPCIILNTYHNTPDAEIDRDADVAIQPLKNSRKPLNKETKQ